MKILVAGGRYYANKDRVFSVLDWCRTIAKKEAKDPVEVIIHGGCTGADAIAGTWARERGLKEEIFLPDWAKLGPSAGPIRNQRMIQEGNPDVAVIFPGGKGTADMVKRLKAAGIATWESSK